MACITLLPRFISVKSTFIYLQKYFFATHPPIPATLDTSKIMYNDPPASSETMHNWIRKSNESEFNSNLENALKNRQFFVVYKCILFLMQKGKTDVVSGLLNMVMDQVVIKLEKSNTNLVQLLEIAHNVNFPLKECHFDSAFNVCVRMKNVNLALQILHWREQYSFTVNVSHLEKVLKISVATKNIRGCLAAMYGLCNSKIALSEKVIEIALNSVISDVIAAEKMVNLINNNYEVYWHLMLVYVFRSYVLKNDTDSIISLLFSLYFLMDPKILKRSSYSLLANSYPKMEQVTLSKAEFPELIWSLFETVSLHSKNGLDSLLHSLKSFLDILNTVPLNAASVKELEVNTNKHEETLFSFLIKPLQKIGLVSSTCQVIPSLRENFEKFKSNSYSRKSTEELSPMILVMMNVLIESCSLIKDSEHAHYLLLEIFKLGTEPSIDSFSALMAVYYNCDEFDSIIVCYKVFQNLGISTIPVDISSPYFNSILPLCFNKSDSQYLSVFVYGDQRINEMLILTYLKHLPWARFSFNLFIRARSVGMRFSIDLYKDLIDRFRTANSPDMIRFLLKDAASVGIKIDVSIDNDHPVLSHSPTEVFSELSQSYGENMPHIPPAVLGNITFHDDLTKISKDMKWCCEEMITVITQKKY